jgi:CheY-like chemotaxis protein/anti-sigma regulatory factor (Ser/Thr protein kinase)
MMRMADITDPEVRWSREVIERQTVHMTRLVDDLLDVSRLTTGKIALRAHFLDARDVIAQAVEAARTAIQARQHQLEIAVADHALPVLGDDTRLVQVLTNLLNNAAKYTPDHGRIRLAASREGTSIVIRISDNGVGIPSHLLPRIFNIFVQGQRTLDRPEGGLGIGLTMVRQLVRLHGGSVEASSEGPGKGAEFVVRIPAASNPGRSTLNVEEPVRGHAHEDHRVLIVDDNRDSAETMARILEHWGYPARCAYDGRSACVLARDWRPKTILLDLGLPGMSGYEVLQALRTDAGLATATIVAKTGYGNESRLATGAAGFADHFVKPVDLTKLKQLLERPVPA